MSNEVHVPIAGPASWLLTPQIHLGFTRGYQSDVARTYEGITNKSEA